MEILSLPCSRLGGRFDNDSKRPRPLCRKSGLGFFQIARFVEQIGSRPKAVRAGQVPQVHRFEALRSYIGGAHIWSDYLAVVRRKTFNAKTPRRQGAKAQGFLKSGLSSCRSPSRFSNAFSLVIEIWLARFASLPLCVFALNSDCMVSALVGPLWKQSAHFAVPHQFFQ